MRGGHQTHEPSAYQDWPAVPGHVAVTPGREETCPVGGFTPDASATTVIIAIRPGNNLQEQTLVFRIPAGIDPSELRTANFGLAGGLATFTVAWVREGDPDDGYFDAPFGESGQTLLGAVNIAKRRLQVYLRARGMTPCFTYDQAL